MSLPYNNERRAGPLPAKNEAMDRQPQQLLIGSLSVG